MLRLFDPDNMKNPFGFITRSYEPKPNDFLVLSWFFLFCGLIGLVLYILGELHSVGDFGFFGSRLLRFCPLAMSIHPFARSRLREVPQLVGAGAGDRRIGLVGARRHGPAALLDQRALIP